MARIRTVKPEFFTHEDLSLLSPETHLLAAGLLCYADDEGYFNANPKLIQSAVFPVRELSSNIPVMLRELSSGPRFIRLGTSLDGRKWGQVINFKNHQVISHPKPSKIKDMEIRWEDSSNVPVTVHPERKGKERNRERNGTITCTEPVIETLPLNDDSEFPVTQSEVSEWSRLYPAVDVPQEIRAMRAWLIANKTKRKTRGGIKRFENSWLARAQDRGHGNGAKNGNGAAKTTDAGRANRNIQALVLSGMGAGVQRNDVPDGPAVQHRAAGGSSRNRGTSPVAGGEILERKS